MAQRALRPSQSRDEEPRLSDGCRRASASTRKRGCQALAVLMVVVTWFGPAALAGNGPGIGFKIGGQTLDNPMTQEKTTRARYAIEVSSPVFEDVLDLAVSVGGSSLGSYDDEYIEIGDDVFIEEYYSDDLSVIDVRLAARLYPLGDSRPIRPYLGAGVGYFWFLDSWDDEYYVTVEDPGDPGTYITYSEEDEDTDTLADGFFPFVLGGFTIPIGDNFECLFEFQFDIEKEDSGFDLGGPIYLFGARFRF